MSGTPQSLVIRNARTLTLADGPRPRRGEDLRRLAIIPSADVLIENGRIVGVFAAGSEKLPASAREIDARGRVLMPAFIDCHTHACWAGARIDEWERKLAGASYLEILNAGGGIMSTVRAVRAAPQEGLSRSLLARLDEFLQQGTTTVEVKSGYGLSTRDELKMLRAIRAAGQEWGGSVISTALLGHAIDGDAEAFVRTTIRETLPGVIAEFPGITVDAFCEKSAWSFEDTCALFKAAIASGCPVRVHADQFNALGMTPAAVAMNARSVDHLEASTEADLRVLAASGTIGVGLPICGMHLDGRYADLRFIVDAGGAVAIATNCNPGSAPSTSMPLAIAAAVRHCGLTPHEAIAACTVNAAAVLGLQDRGEIAPGQRADLILLKHTDERALAFEVGGNPVDAVICGGRLIREN
jgi:imidazolonepropionase